MDACPQFSSLWLASLWWDQIYRKILSFQMLILLTESIQVINIGKLGLTLWGLGSLHRRNLP